MIRRYAALIGIVCAALLALFLYIRVRYGAYNEAKASVPGTVAVLPQNDKEQILIDPVKHSLIIVKPTGNETLTLPDHQSTIDIHKDGTVSVTSPQYGLEHRLFLGVQGSDKFRLAAGMDAYYFKKLDLGLGIGAQIGPHDPIAFVKVSYSFYDNCQVGITYGTDRLIGGILTLRV